MTAKFLLRGGCVLTMGRANFAEADVLIDGAKIVEVGPGLRDRDAEVVDATDTIVMPGFVDSHRHVSESLFRNFGDASSSAGFGQHYEPEDAYAATIIGLLGAIDAGITTVVDWFDLGQGVGCLEAALQAHADSGIRSVLAIAAPTGAPAGDGWRADLKSLIGKVAASSMLTMAAGAPTPTSGPFDAVAADWALARELGLRIHTHVGIDPNVAGGLVADLAARGLLGGDVTLVQCTHLGDADFDAIASSGAAEALTPSSGMSGGEARPPMQELLDRGIRPGLGVGSELASPGDLFAQMRAVISVQHATLFDLKLAGKAGIPTLLNTREVLRYATVDGARAAGLDGVVGSLAPGRQADLVMLRTDRPNIFPINDPIGAVVWGMDTSNVDWVFVGGRPMKRAGKLQGDVARATELANSAQRRVASAAGLLAGAASEGAR
ncbi:MAG: amidohydrolase family protein [Actinomycetota bacterium]|nr:amidohydrolase family protein [Actinomycetota bacterium]